MTDSEKPNNLLTLLLLFSKIGSLGFGGGIATISLMEDELIDRRQLLPLEEFVHGVGLAHLLGGFAVNLAAFIGYRLFGIAGAFLSVIAFLAPSFLLTIGLSYLYFRYHSIPALGGVLAGLSPAVIAVILNASWLTGRRVLNSIPSVLIAFVTLVVALFRVNAAIILVAAGAIGFFLPSRPSLVTKLRNAESPRAGPVAQKLWNVLPMLASMTSTFMTFLKMGLVFFGGGFVLIPILHDQLVSQLHWLTPHEFLDGLAISNLTPGPVALVVAFAGFHLQGVPGALAATAGLFAPGVLLMLAISQQYGRFSAADRARRFLMGVEPAVTGLIVNAAILLGRKALVSWQAYAAMTLSLVMLIRFRWHPALLLAIGAVIGYFGLLP